MLQLPLPCATVAYNVPFDLELFRQRLADPHIAESKVRRMVFLSVPHPPALMSTESEQVHREAFRIVFDCLERAGYPTVTSWHEHTFESRAEPNYYDRTVTLTFLDRYAVSMDMIRTLQRLLLARWPLWRVLISSAVPEAWVAVYPDALRGSPAADDVELLSTANERDMADSAEHRRAAVAQLLLAKRELANCLGQLSTSKCRVLHVLNQCYECTDRHSLWIVSKTPGRTLICNDGGQPLIDWYPISAGGHVGILRDDEEAAYWMVVFELPNADQREVRISNWMDEEQGRFTISKDQVRTLTADSLRPVND